MLKISQGWKKNICDGVLFLIKLLVCNLQLYKKKTIIGILLWVLRDFLRHNFFTEAQQQTVFAIQKEVHLISRTDLKIKDIGIGISLISWAVLEINVQLTGSFLTSMFLLMEWKIPKIPIGNTRLLTGLFLNFLNTLSR